MINDYYIIKEAAENWGLTERWVRTLCTQGKVEAAVQFGRVWAILKDEENPVDGRVTTGEYKYVKRMSLKRINIA